VQSKLPAQNIVATDTVMPIIAEEYKVKIDTLTLKSEPFLLNNLLCNWKHFLMIYDNYGIDIEAKLYDYKTKKIILEYDESPKFPEYYYDYKSVSYFDSINKKYFDDFNFDGLKDFSIYKYGSMPMTSGTEIYLFNKKTKTFDYSEDLTDNIIEEKDSIKRLLKTSSWNMQSNTTKIHHFDKSGKLIFSEQFDYPNDTLIVHYQKIINQKIVEKRTKTIKE
jgi:hypothetical protein